VDRPDETQATPRNPGSGHSNSWHSGARDSFREFESGAGFAKARRYAPCGDSSGHESEASDSAGGDSEEGALNLLAPRLRDHDLIAFGISSDLLKRRGEENAEGDCTALE
jgi:hypothetical protein